MLKTISAALLAVSVLAAPALAAGQGSVQPATKAQQVKLVKTSMLNANASMKRHHRHHRHHKHMGALKKHYISKITIKHEDRIVKRS